MRARIIYCFAAVFSALYSFAQTPQLHPPIDPPILLSGTFAELRSGHFHAGIDIKSHNGRPGQPIYAIDDGSIHLIYKQPFSLGNGLIINHPSGYQSVYGHLERFSQKLDSVVTSYQYEHQIAHFQLYATQDSFEILVKKGDIIGFLGNSGNSFGPHLHFEMRKDGFLRNPLQFFPVNDRRKPSYINTYCYPIFTQSQSILEPVLVDHDQVLSWPYSQLGIGIEAIDLFNGRNKNGIYSITILHNGKKVYQMKLDSIKTNHDNYYGHIDSRIETIESKRIYKCFPSFGQTSTISEGKGIIDLGIDSIHYIEIHVSDYNGNQTIKQFALQRQGNPHIAVANQAYWWFPTILQSEHASVVIPPNTLYQNATIRIEHGDTNQLEFLPIGLHFKQPVAIYWKHQTDRSQILVKHSGDKKTRVPVEQQADTTIFTTSSTGFWSWCTDTIPPEIQLISQQNDQIIFSLSDNINHLDYSINCFLDDLWIPHEFNLLRKTIKISGKDLFDNKHKLMINVEDTIGNNTRYTIQLKK